MKSLKQTKQRKNFNKQTTLQPPMSTFSRAHMHGGGWLGNAGVGQRSQQARP